MANDLAMRFDRALRDDRLLRVPLALAFALLGVAQANRLYLLALDRLPQQVGSRTLAMAANGANLMFVLLLAWLTLVRSVPSQSAKGWGPRLYALIGTFALLFLGALPTAELSDELRMVSILLILVGGMLSLFTVNWLGRSFSIVAQSRSLVTSGPYAIIRHPLYVCEEIAILGGALDHLSWTVAIIVAGHWYCQLRRMKYEEGVLRATFPEYEAYAQRTPALIPTISFKQPSWAKRKA